MPKGNSRKIKPVALAVTELRLSEGISQALVSQSVTQSVSRKFCSNLLKAFWVDLKACLGLALFNQYCPIIVWEK